MDDQFGGRTDDDLFADDFEPIQLPTPPTAASEPAAVITATIETPVTLSATPSTIKQSPITAPVTTQASKGRKNANGTHAPSLGEGAAGVNGPARRNRQPKPKTGHGAQKADAAVAPPSSAAATTSNLPASSTDLLSAVVPPPSLAQSRHNQPITPQPADAAQLASTSISVPVPAHSDSASPAPQQQTLGQKSRRGHGGEKKKRNSGHVQAKDEDTPGRESPAPDSSQTSIINKMETPTDEKQPPTQNQQNQKQQRQSKQRQQNQQEAGGVASDRANATKVEKEETSNTVGTEGTTPVVPKVSKAARSGNKGGSGGKGGGETAGAANTGISGGPASNGPNARIQSGANPRTRLTEAELEMKMSAMRLAAEEKTRRFEQAQRDERDHDIAMAKGREEARKRKAAEEEKRKRSEEDRRRLEEERSRNRDRKLKAMGVKEGNWDEGKDNEGDQSGRDGSGVDAVMRGVRPAAGILPIANASAVTAKAEPTPTPSRGGRRGGRGERGERVERGGRAGRGGRGGGRSNNGDIRFNDAGSIGADIAEWVHSTTGPSTMPPPSPGPSENGFPSLSISNVGAVTKSTGADDKPAAKGQSYAAKVAIDKKPAPAGIIKTAEAAENMARDKLGFPPLPSLPAVGAWDEEVEEAERNAKA
ncbi:hypothetical protein SEPCBS57363_006735 [Sporothrix epigloea]|uniref:Uncharacterized protein n=1 Tax=Sporothrix epigloea TaxID=1892477 RepID=A0ABP0E4Y5_9PEZI